eukprot:TRINITY_DN1908_c0_g3_i3.p1 TRINITY_DN1908_c0_g3~~TRINITY_DN1908_c0_g3_i3.p1  ORF type:complete len:382 (+),score=62.13 TRINITY_DN1908_c0_g3_i3:98-1147(+)
MGLHLDIQMGPGLVYLDQPNKSKVSEEGETDMLKYCATSMQGWRINMEDAHLSISKFGGDPTACLFAVFDGHGGIEIAEFARLHFPEELLKNPDYIAGRFKEALSATFLKIDAILSTEAGKKEVNALTEKFKDPSKISRLSSTYGEEEWDQDYIGCTSNVLLIKNKTLYIANAGDSRSIASVKGKVVELSHDHKPDLESERKRILKAGGCIWEGRIEDNLYLSRALGNQRFKANSNLQPQEQIVIADPEVQIEKLTSDYDFIIMGCDGVYETKTNQQIIDFFAEQFKSPTQPSLKTAVEKFLDSNLSTDYMKTDGAGCDNMTCIAIIFKNFHQMLFWSKHLTSNHHNIH